MRHAMPFSVFFLLLAAFSGGATIGSAADKVAVGAGGAFKVIEKAPNDFPFVLEKDQPAPSLAAGIDDTPFEVDHKLDGAPDTPFEIDPSVNKPVRSQLASASEVQDATTDANDSPFDLDPKGAAPPAPPPRPSLEDMPYNFGVQKAEPVNARSAPAGDSSPFVVEPKEGAAPPAHHAPPGASPTLVAAPVSDSPFEMTQGAAPAAAAPPAAPMGNAPFVVDTKMQPEAATSQASQPKAVVVDTAQADTHSKGTGSSTIVRNSDPHPGPQVPEPPTTRMVVRFPAEIDTTTASPASTTALRFELGESMIEVNPGQMFVSIPSTPFEMDRRLVMKLAKTTKPVERRKKIELMRDDIEAPEPPRPAALIAEEEKMPEELPAVREVAPVMPHVAKRLMRNEEVSEQHRQYYKESLTSGHPELWLAGMTGAPLSTTPSAVTTGAIEANRLKEAASDTSEESMPVAVQSALHPAITLPGAKQNDPTVPLADQSNDSMSEPASIFNATSAELPLNVTNITAHLPKVITARGAVISIFLGFLVTVFFFSFLLCVLKAGRLESEKTADDEKEPPRQTRTYRQLLASQMVTQEQPPEASPVPSTTPSAPSV